MAERFFPWSAVLELSGSSKIFETRGKLLFRMPTINQIKKAA
jgi:hypothetical protein